MDGYLKQSTASQTRPIGPFIDDTDFKTAKTGLSIANTDIKLSKHGGAYASKNSGGGTHDSLGEYMVTFDATDTATVGQLKYIVKMTGALAVWGTFTVVEEAVYDALFLASAPGYVVDQPVNVTKLLGTAWLTPGTAGTPDVNAKLIGGTSQTGADVGSLVAKFVGITKLSEWLGAMAGKQASDATAQTEMRATGAGSGTYTATTDSQEALRDRGDAAWITATGFSTLDAAGVRAAVGLASANLDTQLAAIAGYLDTEIAAILAAVDTEIAALVAATYVRTGTAQAGAGTTITLDAGASATNSLYVNQIVVITSGTGAGQARFITAYVGATKVATVATWQTNPDNTSVFYILPFGAIPGATAPTAAEVADAVLEELITDHSGVSGSLAAYIANIYSVIDTEVAAILAAVDTEVATIMSKTNNLPASPAATGDAMTLTSGERNSVADALLNRNVAGGSSAGRLVKEALYRLRNKVSIAGGTATVYGTDDSTSAWTAAVTTAAGNPVSEIDPA